MLYRRITCHGGEAPWTPAQPHGCCGAAHGLRTGTWRSGADFTIGSPRNASIGFKLDCRSASVRRQRKLKTLWGDHVILRMQHQVCTSIPAWAAEAQPLESHAVQISSE